LSVYVTEYVVVEVGETLIVFVVEGLFVQAYVPPTALGVAVNVALCPEQTVALLTLTVGTAFTVTVPLPVALHPFNVYNTL